jgi:hypothetical protein
MNYRIHFKSLLAFLTLWALRILFFGFVASLVILGAIKFLDVRYMLTCIAIFVGLLGLVMLYGSVENATWSKAVERVRSKTYICEKCGLLEEDETKIVTREETLPVKGENVTVTGQLRACEYCDTVLNDEVLDDAQLRAAYAIYRERHGLAPDESIANFTPCPFDIGDRVRVKASVTANSPYGDIGRVIEISVPEYIRVQYQNGTNYPHKPEVLEKVPLTEFFLFRAIEKHNEGEGP